MKKLVTLLTALTLMFTSAALAETAFKTDEAGHPVFENFGEAKQYARAGLIESDYYMIIVPEDHTFYRIRTDYDEKAKALYENYSKLIENKELANDAIKQFQEYCSTLPAQYDSEFTADPISQKELDKLVGKTLKEAKEEGYTQLPYYNTEETDIVSFALEQGMFRYSVTLNESYAFYRECYEKNNFDNLTIKSMTWDGQFAIDAYHDKSDEQ